MAMRHGARIASKQMPRYVPERRGVIGWVLLAIVGAGAAYLYWSHPIVLAAVGPVAGVSCVLAVAEGRRQRRIAAERRDESICSFARSFDCRATDTWIVRAVFEELTRYVRFPIRPDDRLRDDLKIDHDDVGDIAEVIAQRTGRQLLDCEANPLYGRVTTVRELVEFFVRQPRREGPLR